MSDRKKSKSKKVNVNTTDLETLMEKVGMAKQTAQQIIAYRKKYGPFSTITDLIVCPRVTQKMLDRYSDLIEV